MLVVREYVGLHRQVGAARVGNVDAVEAAALGYRLRSQVFFQSYREVGPGFYPAVVGNDRRPVAVYLPDPGHDPAAGDILDVRVIHAEARQAAEFEEIGSGIDEFAYERSDRLFPVRGEAVHGLPPAGPQRLVQALVE